MRRTTVIGASAADVGKGVFGIVHGIGKGILNAFSLGTVAESLEKAEIQAGLLPSASKVTDDSDATDKPTTQPPARAARPDIVVTHPDAIVLIQQSRGKKVARGVSGLQQVLVRGGVRFDGNGYKTGDPVGQTFSFGVNHPARIETTDARGQRMLVSARQVLFLGGIERAPVVGADVGLIESQILGWSVGDTALSILTFGASTPWSVIKEAAEYANPKRYSQMTFETRPTVPSAAKTAAQARLKAVQGRQTSVQDQLRRTKAPSTFVPTVSSVPSFSFSSASSPFAPLPPPFPTTTPGSSDDAYLSDKSPVDSPSTGSETTADSTVGIEQGETHMSQHDDVRRIEQEVCGVAQDFSQLSAYKTAAQNLAAQQARLTASQARLQQLQAHSFTPISPATLTLPAPEPVDYSAAPSGYANTPYGDPSGQGPLSAEGLPIDWGSATQPGEWSPGVVGTEPGWTEMNDLVGEVEAVIGKHPHRSRCPVVRCPICSSELCIVQASQADPSGSLPGPALVRQQGVPKACVVGALAPLAAKEKTGTPVVKLGTRLAGTCPCCGTSLDLTLGTQKPCATAAPATVDAHTHGTAVLGSSYWVGAGLLNDPTTGKANPLNRFKTTSKTMADPAGANRSRTTSDKAGGKLGDRTGLKTTRVQTLTARRTGKKSPHKMAMDRTERVVKFTEKRAKKVAKKAASYKPKDHKTLVPVKLGDVKGKTVLGAATPAGKPLTPKQQAAVQKHTDAMVKTVHAVDRSKAAAEKAAVAASQAKAALKKAKPEIDKLTKRGKIRVVGDVLGAQPGFEEVCGELEFVLGAQPGFEEVCGGPTAADLNPDDKEAAELLTLLDYIDEMVGDDPTVDPTADPVAPATTDETFEDAGDIPLPTRGQPLSQNEARTVYWNKSDVPEDAVYYQGDRGAPQNGFGSWNVFYGDQKNPHGWGIPGFLYGWREGEGTHWLYAAPERKDPLEFAPVPPEFEGNLKMIAKNSAERGWGPLIGNPKSDMAGLQLCVETGDWFWQGDKAPVWASAIADAKITELNKKTAAAKQAADEAEAAYQAQVQAQMDEDQRKQDAANALAQSAADTQANIAAQQQQAREAQYASEQQNLTAQTAAAQAASDIESRKSEYQLAALQAQMEAQLAQSYQQQELAQQQMAMEMQRAQLAWAQAHPEAAPMPVDTGATATDESEAGGNIDYVDPDESVDYGMDAEFTGDGERGREDRW